VAGSDSRNEGRVTESGPGPGPLSRLLADLVDAPVDMSGGTGRVELKPGRQVNRFEILREIGSGGFGVVFEARDTGLGRHVALKLLRPGSRVVASARHESIQREAEAVALLAHPSIVTLYDFGTCDAGPYLVMELLHGESLQRRLRRQPFPLGEALRISVELAQALDHAHGAGILHRDLKPGNLFMTRDGGVKVLDFGLALVFGASGRLAGGTPAYMSPEQWRDGPQDGRTDVWSAAVILYQLLTGELPFHPERGWTADRVEQALRVPSIPGAPSGLAPLLQRALSIDPGPRPADGRAWLQALQEVRAELEAGAGPDHGSTRVAVLPFTDLGNPGPADFLAGSLTALLIAELARVTSLRVSSRNTAMAYLGTTKPVRQVGAELGVEKVIEGSVLRTGDELQISVRLLDVQSERQEWTERYREPIGNVLDVLDGVVGEVSRTLGALLGPNHAGSAGGRVVATSAIDAYLRGQYHQSKRTPEGFAAALAEYRAANDADPLFAAPYVGTGFAHLMSAIYGFAPTRQALSLARLNAERALALDPGSGEALGALAGVQLFHDHDFAVALATARRAVALNPSHVMSRVVLGDVLWVFDRVGEAIEQIESALRRDPLDLGINMNVGDFLVFAGRFEEAVAALERLLRINPNFLPGHVRLAKALAFAGDRAGAEAELAVVSASAPEAMALETLALCHATLGDHARARPLAEELDRRAGLQRGTAIAAANAWAALGDGPAALRMLERAWDALEPFAVVSARYPPTRRLFETAPFAEFGRRVGLPRFVEPVG
jgi:TolB-like protein/tetratricopeptide (TPR) repeat protein